MKIEEGKVSRGGELYNYLKDRVLQARQEELSPNLDRLDFRVYRLQASHHVFKVVEKKSGIAFLIKSYAEDQVNDEIKRRRFHRELENVHLLERFDIGGAGHCIAVPFFVDTERFLIAYPFFEGKELSHYIKKAVLNGKEKTLKHKLSALADFLYSLHKHTDTEGVETSQILRSFMGKIKRAERANLIDANAARQMRCLIEKWTKLPLLRDGRKCLIHGDATPSNFLFKRTSVAVIDLENIAWGDRSYDLGMVAGELKHQCMMHSGNRFAAEGYIGHFYWEYSRRCSDPCKAFRILTAKNPFYMAYTEFRIAGNEWLAWDHRKWLAFEGMECLKALHRDR
jgi:thiamine kinase-like enzyme